MLFLRTILLDSLRGGEKWFKGSEGDFIPSKIGNQCTVFVKKCTCTFSVVAMASLVGVCAIGCLTLTTTDSNARASMKIEKNNSN